MKFKRKHKIKWIIVLAVILIIAATVYIIFNSAIMPAVFSLAEIKLKVIANWSINEAVKETFGSGISYSDLVDIQKDDTGKIRSISANAININNLASKVSSVIQTEIASAGQQGIDIPIGTILGGPLLTGRGPAINVRVEPVGVVNTKFLTAFEEAGINQTRHLIYLDIRVDMRMVVSNTVDQVSYSSRLLIADTVIVGDIPEQYMQFDDPGGTQSLAPLLLMDKYSGDD